MEIGMLWFDDSQLDLDKKISRAVAFYGEKYGRPPTLCLIHPITLDGEKEIVAGVQIRQASSVMPDHFWIGVEEKPRRIARTADHQEEPPLARQSDQPSAVAAEVRSEKAA
jgi:hypothetical protein